MADTGKPKFHNDAGVEKIFIGAKQFQCVGATPPYDHPHIYLDMGDDNEIICPYCSTLYVHQAGLAKGASDPAGAAYSD